MEYQALYRKYRPKNFDEVSGQSISLKILQNSIVNNKIVKITKMEFNVKNVQCVIYLKKKNV